MASVFKTPEGERAVREHCFEMIRQWPSPTHHRLATREGETFVTEVGPRDAPAVLLLHGTAANSAMWSSGITGWSRRLRLLAVDIIGDAGMSAPSRPPMHTDAHALWLDDVLEALSLNAVAIIGISLGGWIALDYASRRPHRVERLVVINPGGVGRPRNVLLWALPLLMLGKWGRHKMMEKIAGKVDPDSSGDLSAAAEFTSLIFKHFKPRTASLPQFGDEALERISMPLLAILGGKDVFIDAQDARLRLEAHAKNLTVRFLPDAHHFVPGQEATIEAFLANPAAPVSGGR